MAQCPGNNPTTGRPFNDLSHSIPAIPPLEDHAAKALRRQALKHELNATRRDLAELRELLETLPEIFERKFEERLSPMLTQRQRLLEQNEQARAQLQLCGDAADTNLQLSDGQAGPRWGQALRHALGWTPEQRSA